MAESLSGTPFMDIRLRPALVQGLFLSLPSGHVNSFLLLVHVQYLLRCVKSQVSFIPEHLVPCLRPTETSAHRPHVVALHPIEAWVVHWGGRVVDGVWVDLGGSQEEGGLKTILFIIASYMMTTHQLLDLCQLRLMKVGLSQSRVRLLTGRLGLQQSVEVVLVQLQEAQLLVHLLSW